MSVADKIKSFIDAHAPELEALLGEAETTATAIDPALAPVLPLFGELTTEAKAAVTDIVRMIHGKPGNTAAPAPAADPEPAAVAEPAAPPVPDLPTIPAQASNG